MEQPARKAVQFDRTGDPADVLSVCEIQSSDLQHGQVRVAMAASPINPSDEMFIRGTYGTPPVFPQIPGFEGTGTVVASGGGLKGRLFTGKRVAVLNATGGNWAQQTTVPASQVIPLSKRLSEEQAATFFVNPATAWLLTQEVLRVQRGGWLVQTAAASALGKMVIRLGQRLGFRTLNIVRHERHIDTLKRLGADAVIVADENNAEKLPSLTREHLGDTAATHIIDPVGGATGSALIRSLGHQGRFVSFGTLSNSPLVFSGRELMTRNARVEGFWLGPYMKSRSLVFKLKLIKRLTQFVLDGTLATEISRTVTLEDVPQSFSHHGDGRTLIRI